MQAFMERKAVDDGFQITDPMMVGKVFMELGVKMIADPQKLTEGPVRFVLSASGHIAGVINPPAAGKYCFWTAAKTPANPNA